MIREKISELSKNMKEDHISESSAQCAYYTILSFIPFIMLVITLIQYTGVEPQTLFDVISKIIPSSMSEMILGIVQEVYSKSIGTISISVIFTIWAAGKGLYALTKGLQIVYNTDDKEKFGTLENYNLISSIATEIGLIFVTFIVFILLYKFMPKHKMALKTQVYGAIFGAIALNVISFVFSRYLTIFKGFSITYGSLTTVMLIMMWTYSCFYALFLGAELNKILNQKKEN